MGNTYAIGDIHGCYATFLRLLTQIQFNPQQDKLWLVGDLVNRGPDSAAVLRWAMRHDDCVVAVLGNHDLSLLVAHTTGTSLENDSLAAVLTAADADDMCEWLRQRPLAHYQHNSLLIHAGVLPAWTTADVLRLAAETETLIRGKSWNDFATQLYGNTPAAWDETLTGVNRARLVINALTRLRVCTPKGEMRLDFFGDPSTLPSGYVPWFDAPQRRTVATPIICGHWSALGLMRRGNVCAIDSGCCRGGSLTALRLSDGAVFQEAATPSSSPPS